MSLHRSGTIAQKSVEGAVVNRQDFRVNSGGIRLATSLFVPPWPGPHPGLVLCHGMPAGPQIGGVVPQLSEGDIEYPALAELCAWEGFATVIFNFRGTGQSQGNFHHLGWATDLDAILSWFIERPELDLGRIVLLGSSLGAAVAIYVAAQRQEVSGVVSFAGPAVMGPRAYPLEAVERMRKMGIIRDPDFPYDIEEWALEGEKLSPDKWIGKVSPRPILLIHGDSDNTVNPDNMYKLFECAGEPKYLRLLPGVGHRFRQEQAAIGEVLLWISEKFLIQHGSTTGH